MDIIILVSIIVSVASLAISLYLILKLRKIQNSQKILFEGKDAKNLEQIVMDMVKRGQRNENDIKEIYKITDDTSGILDGAIKKIKAIRYNPFGDKGGDQSFSVALLDSHDNGIIISSLHLRQASRVFCKPITKGESKYILTDEEKELLNKK